MTHLASFARYARYFGILAFLFAASSGSSRAVAEPHGIRCAQECDAHVGHQCPNPSEAWFFCLATCLYMDCGGHQPCIDSGIAEANQWCASQPG